MSGSQLVEVSARAINSGHSQLTQVAAYAVGSAGRSQLTEVSAYCVSTGHSQLTGVSAMAVNSSLTAILSGPSIADVGDVIVLSLATSFGATFTGYAFTQLSGPTASLAVSGDHVTVTCPAVKPNAAGFPNDGPLQMVFQGIVSALGGAQQSADTHTVDLYAHLTWAADGTPLYWHLP